MDRGDAKYLVIPDVHGRDFWMKPVEEVLMNPEMKIVFLGDYLDPYPYEWEDENTTRMEARVKCKEVALSRFKQIIDLKKKHPKQITLLLGNHDCGYAIGSDICDCRTDYDHREEIEYLFKDNRELFQLAYSCDISGKRFLFSHAGILQGWVKQVWTEEQRSLSGFKPDWWLNCAWWAEDYRVLNFLGDYDGWRSNGFGFKYGSPVWSDIRSWVKVKEEDTYGFNIVGHTQTNGDPVVLDCIADLDCHRCFYLDDQGRIRDWDNGKVWEKTRVE